MMKRLLKTTILAAAIALGATQAQGQAMYISHARVNDDIAAVEAELPPGDDLAIASSPL